ncbi:nucleoside phosphatase family-domain-containing protein [Lipomyces oligophaga]|uniref:nucleoside phosphatase family-domain-containing protein n=1 Tax=Lipomyces oligophaga TaxID=45792 RepID=UPI0034D01FC7
MPAIPPQRRNYGIVIDAGSSGSRVQIYAWPTVVDASSHAVPKVGKGGDDWQLKVRPGISDYSTHPEELEVKHLDPLLEYAKKIIPAEKHSETPIFLLATAGMRLLSDNDRQILLDKTCFHFKTNSKFLIPDCETHVRVIDGETEGLYGWLALNYMLGSIDSPEKHAHGKGHSTYGFLDMGGASAQIAFAPNASEAVKHMDDLYRVRLRSLSGHALEYNVFVSTWLGYGANQARRRYMELLYSKSKQGKSGNSILDPCSPNGLLTSDIPELKGLILEGTGNLTQCLAFTYPLLSKDLSCPDEPCLFGGVHAPAIDFDVNHFIGVSEFWHTTRSGLFVDELDNETTDEKGNPMESDLEIEAIGAGQYDYASFLDAVEKFCSRDWTVLEKAASGKSIDLSKLKEMCFKGSWVMNVLHSGFNIPTSSNNKGDLRMESKQQMNYLDSFQSISSVNGVELSWTLGKMVLYASSQVPIAPELVKSLHGNATAIADRYDVGLGPNSGAFEIERVDLGAAIPDLTIFNNVDHGREGDDNWWGHYGFNATIVSSEGTFGQRRIPGLFLFALIFIVMAYVLFGKVRRRKFTFSLAPKRYQRRVVGGSGSAIGAGVGVNAVESVRPMSIQSSAIEM